MLVNKGFNGFGIADNNGCGGRVSGAAIGTGGFDCILANKGFTGTDIGDNNGCDAAAIGGAAATGAAIGAAIGACVAAAIGACIGAAADATGADDIGACVDAALPTIIWGINCGTDIICGLGAATAFRLYIRFTGLVIFTTTDCFFFCFCRCFCCFFTTFFAIL